MLHMQSRNLHIEISESILSTTKTIPTKAYVSSISSFITAMEQVVHISILDLVIMIMCSLQSSLFLYIGTNVGSRIKPIISGTI